MSALPIALYPIHCTSNLSLYFKHEINKLYKSYTPVERGLHFNTSEEFEDPAVSEVKLEWFDV